MLEVVVSTRRTVLAWLGATSVFPAGIMSSFAAARNTGLSLSKPLRVRTITAGVELADATQLDRIERAVAVLKRGRQVYEAAGYEVETVRIATNPFLAGADARAREKSLSALQALDRLMVESNTIVSIGPVLTADRDDADFPSWAAELVRSTRTISFSTVIASTQSGVQAQSAGVAARTMNALAGALPDGVGNFRFAAAANIPAGTPFFPVAWHQGPESLAIGLESASVVEDAFAQAEDTQHAGVRLKALLNQVLQPVERLAIEFARKESRVYLGIDSSPAPAKDRSIAAAIEALIRKPFGSASTLAACSTVTAAIKALDVKTCGYSGLMLPVLEDPLLAQRAGEGRYSIRDLLLYSSVCGTGLDVVPVPGDTAIETLTGLLKDVAALSARLTKPLSARLFIVPGKKAGEIARFTDPLLTNSVVMKID